MTAIIGAHGLIVKFAPYTESTGTNMWSLGEIADWWDEQRRQASEEVTSALDQYVFEDGSTSAVVLATAGYTAAEFSFLIAEGFVDVLRLGEGVQEGGWGYAEDGMRLLAALPLVRPLSRITQGALRTMREPLRRFVRFIDPGGGRCTWVAAARALRETGVRHFARLDDVIGGSASLWASGAMESVWVEQAALNLRALGARVWMIPRLRSLAEAADTVKVFGNGVLMFSARWVHAGRNIGHTMLMKHTASGPVIIDRYGKVVRSLTELESLYPGIGNARVYGSAAFVHEAALIEHLPEVAANIGRNAARWFGRSLLSHMALEVYSISMRRPSQSPTTGSQPAPEITARVPLPAAGQFFTDISCQMELDAPAAPCRSIRYYRVASGDSLSVISRAAYGDSSRWRRIFEANPRVLGIDPAHPTLRPRQVLMIPPN